MMAPEAHTLHGARAWLCALTALLLHGAVAMALPKPDRERAEVAMAPVWIAMNPAPPASPSEASKPGGSAPTEADAPDTSAAQRPSVPARTAVRRRRRPAASRSAAVAEAAPPRSSSAPSPTPNTAPSAAQRSLAPAGDRGGLEGALAGSHTGTDATPAGSGSDGEGLQHAVLEAGASCAGFFPAAAAAAEGRVRVRVHVARNGDPESCQVVTESPVGQGFGRAALACAHRLHFLPAHDAAGRTVDDDTTLELGFRRL